MLCFIKLYIINSFPSCATKAEVVAADEREAARELLARDGAWREKLEPTGLVMLGIRGAAVSLDITLGAVLSTLMFLNVWLIIWPNQQVVIGLKEGDGPSSAAKAGLASRTNTLFSGPMALGMLAWFRKRNWV